MITTIEPTTVDEAVAAVREGSGEVYMSVGTAADDPVLRIYRDRDGEIGDALYTTGVGGWSEGITECICDLDSDFIYTFLSGRVSESLVLVVTTF